MITFIVEKAFFYIDKWKIINEKKSWRKQLFVQL